MKTSNEQSQVIVCVDNLSIYHQIKPLLKSVSFKVNKGEFFAVLGPNGAGKTTLINALSGENKHYDGRISIQNQCITSLSFSDLAKYRAVLPQKTQMSFPMSVEDIIALGRQPHANTPQRVNDNVVIDACIEQMDLSHCRSKNYDQISGGEQQRVHIARTFAQILSDQETQSLENKILILDEPTNHLDISHQYAYMDFLKDCQARGLTIITVMHDISLAMQYANHILLLKSGEDHGYFTPKQIIKNKLLNDIYQLDIKSFWNDELERFLIAPSCQKKAPCFWSTTLN